MEKTAKEFRYRFSKEGVTTFSRLDNNVWLKRLFGLDCGFQGQDTGPFHSRGLVLLDTSAGRFESEHLNLKKSLFTKNRVCLVWEIDKGIKVESQWEFSPKTGIWNRKDRIQNTGPENITLFRYLSRFVFSPGRYETYSQSSRWCGENQGNWQPLHQGSIRLGCEGGRTCQSETPYMCLRETEQQTGIAFHLLPKGNWTICVSIRPVGGDLPPVTVVELGLSDENLRFRLTKGDTIEFPEILVHPLPDDEVHLGAPRLHRYLLNNYFHRAKSYVPVVYNTWFDKSDNLDVERLQKQLTAAKEVGCEIFTVDAGWYGAGIGNWYEQVGDWREKVAGAFLGKMAKFADRVRATGLGFGLWIEPERISPSAPILKEHPEWFLTGSNNCYYPDLKNAAVHNYIRTEITRLIEKYHLTWLKSDFNFDFDADPSGTEFYSYYAIWYQILDELRSRYPGVFFEGCASGGMRLDLATLTHFDGHFLSDTVEPVDVLRIYQGALLRLPPGRLGKWLVLRPAGQSNSPGRLTDDPNLSGLISPGGATWERTVTTTVDFSARICLPGMFGLSGDIAGLSEEVKNRIGEHIRFFKKWRKFIAGSVCHLLTPPDLKGDRKSWCALQLQHPVEGAHLLFVYRLDDALVQKRFYPRALEPNRRYEVRNLDYPKDKPLLRKGSQLMDEGLLIQLPHRNSSAVIVVSPYRREKTV